MSEHTVKVAVQSVFFCSRMLLGPFLIGRIYREVERRLACLFAVRGEGGPRGEARATAAAPGAPGSLEASPGLPPQAHTGSH